MSRVYSFALVVALLVFITPSFSQDEDPSLLNFSLTERILKEEGDFWNLFSSDRRAPAPHSHHHRRHGHHHHHAHAPTESRRHHHHHAHAPKHA